jgi:muramoyltetrapeptide carboxypeptidase
MTVRSGVPLERESASQSERANVRKPGALHANSVVMPFAPASPAESSRIAAGVAELRRLGWQVAGRTSVENDGYFAETTTSRRDELVGALQREDIAALVGTRGGYGSNYLLDDLHISTPASPKIILGFSDLTSLQIYLWQRFQWITFYGPMLAAGLDAGPSAPKGYDQKSLLAALQNTQSGWALDLQGEILHPGLLWKRPSERSGICKPMMRFLFWKIVE